MMVTILWLVIVVGLIAVPAILLAFRPFATRWTILVLLLNLLNTVLAAWYLAPWWDWSYWLYGALVLVSVAGFVIGLTKLKKASWTRPDWGVMAAIAPFLLAGLYLLPQNIQSIGARQAPTETIALQSPLGEGTFVAVRAGSGPPLHVSPSPSQQYAVDLIKLNGALTGYQNYLQFEDFTTSETWDTPVYAPCSGTVVYARDGIEDTREPNEERPAGNLIVIDCDGVTVYLAHMRNGTVAVSEGDLVSAGDPIGRIGMSGRTFYPHLHIHAEKGPNMADAPGNNNPGVAIRLEGTFPSTGLILRLGD